MDDKPDLSHLTPEERRIIEEVMNRQKQEEAKDAQLVSKQNVKDHTSTPCTAHISNPSEKSPSSTIINGEIVNKLHKTSNTNTSLPFGSTVANIMAEAVHAVSGSGGGGGGSSTNTPGVTGIGGSHTANVCESCHKTKFADNSGNSCVYCKRRTCTRCGNHSEVKPNVIQWVCKQCIQKLGTPEGQKMSPNSTLPQHTETSVSSITGRLGESIKSFISKPKTPDIKRQLPQVNIRNQNLPYSPDASSGNRLQNAGSGRVLPKPYSTMRSNSLDADKTAYIGPDQSRYYGDQKRPYADRYSKQDHTPGEYGHVRSRRTSGDYYASDEFHPYREVPRQYQYDSRMPNNVYLDTLYTGDSFTSDPSDSPCQSGGSIKHSLSYGRTSAHDYPRYQEMGYRSDQHFDSQSPYLKPNYSSSSFSSQKRNIPNWENYRYGAIPPRYRDQLRHHQLHHLSFSSSDGEDFSVVDDGSVQYQEPRRRLLPTNFERKPSPYSQGTVTDDDDPASQFFISKRSTTPYYGSQLKPHVWDQDRALSLCDEPPRYPYDYETQSEHHRRLPENKNSAYQGGVRYNHEDGTIVTTRRLPKGSSSHPVTWNVSEDGRRLIGHMILRKKSDPQFGEPGSVLGLKLAGGRLDRSRRLCAFVTQIKPGSPADVVGHLRPGDEILEWNGQSLRGLSADEVSQIIYQSKDEIQVELVAQREINETENTPTDDVVLMVPSRSECMNSEEIDAEEHIPKSSLQLKLFYDEIKCQLIINILAARNLPIINQSSRVPCTYYCSLCLLPEQEEYNSRCTKVVSGSINPIWNQAFRFTNFTDNDLNSHHLEIIIWSCGDSTDEQYKIGEIVIDLSVADLLDVAYWYPIRTIHRFFSTSELSNMNPEIGSGAYDMQSYEKQIPEKLIKPRYCEPEQWSPRSVYQDSNIPDEILSKQRLTRGNRNEIRRDDYSDIDEQRFASNIRQNRKPTGQEYQQRGNEERHRSSRRNPKSSEQPVPLKALNAYLRYSIKLAQSKATVEFIENCIENNQYLKSYVKAVRRSKKRPNTRTLKRYALQQIESLQSYMTQLEEKISHTQYAIDEIPQNLKELYIEYANKVIETQGNNKKNSLFDALNNQISGTDLPVENNRAPNFEYGRVEENAIQSDASEFSDLSEFSKMSLHTTPSDHRRTESAQMMHRTVNQQFETPTQSHGERYSRNSKQSDRLDQSFSPSSEQPVRIRRDSNRLEKEMSGSTDERMMPKDSGSSEGGSGQGTSSTGSLGGRGPRPLGENKASTSEIAQNVERDPMDGRKRRPNIGQKFSNVLGRSSKSSSTSTLDKKSRTSFQRSEEVLPFGGYGAIFEGQEQEGSFGNARSSMMHRQLSIGSGKSDGQNPRCGTNSDNTDQDSIYMGRNESHVGEFVEGLGPGQLVGRQVLGMPCLGEIQLSFYDRKGHLEVEVIRARGLQQKNTAKPLPAPYVKLHLLEGKQSVEKLRTMYPPRRTLDPLYQQQLSFSVPYHGKILQVSVWGEYGRMDKKVFLGMCEIVLDDLDLKTVVFGWYKLFGMIASNAHHHHHHHHQQQHQHTPQQKGLPISSSTAPCDDSKTNKGSKVTETKTEKPISRPSRHNNGNNENTSNNERPNRTKSKSSQEGKSTQPSLGKTNDGTMSSHRNLGSPHSTRR